MGLGRRFGVVLHLCLRLNWNPLVPAADAKPSPKMPTRQGRSSQPRGGMLLRASYHYSPFLGKIRTTVCHCFGMLNLGTAWRRTTIEEVLVFPCYYFVAQSALRGWLFAEPRRSSAAMSKFPQQKHCEKLAICVA
jgi:hypothetical protein